MVDDDHFLHATADRLSCEVWEFFPEDNDNDKLEFHIAQTHGLHAGSGYTEQYSWPLPSDSCAGVDVDITSSFNSPPRKLSASTSPCSVSRGNHDVSPDNTITTATRAGRRSDIHDNTNQSTCDASVSSKKRCLRGNNTLSTDHETHIWTERERRKKMRTMFSTLHSLLPHLPSKTDKSTIVDEAIGYIKSLQKSLQVLQNQRLEKTRSAATKVEFRSFELQDSTEPVVDNWRRASHSISYSIDHTLQTWSSPNVVLSVCGEDAQIGICSARRPGQLATIFYTLEKHNVHVLTAHISADTYRCMYMIHAHATTEAAIETFKLVIGDLVMYFSSFMQ